MKLCSRLLMVFGWNFWKKNKKIVYLHPILGKLRVNTTLVDGSLESPWSTFYSRYLNFFRYLLWFWSYEVKCVQPGRFHMQVNLFALKFYLDRDVPINHSWHQKLETLDYPTVETASLCVPSFWQNTRVWRTDGQVDGYAITYTPCFRKKHPLILLAISWGIVVWF